MMLVVNLSPLEIAEDDCNSKFTFNITIKNLRHAKSLIHRYYVDEYDNVKEITKDDINNIIGKKIRLRSPITCMTDNYKICRKCVGNYDFISPYIGILTGQYLEERLTQSTMSSHHLSGAANIYIDDILKEYIKNHLINITNDSNTFELEFDENIPQNIKDVIINNKDYRYDQNISNTILKFKNYNSNEFIPNQDASQIVDNVAALLKSCISTKKVKIPDITDTYYKLIEEFFKISNIYTIFIELLLANSHVNQDNITYRYCLKQGLNPTICKRYSIKSLNRLISKILSWLYEPNKTSIRNFYNYSQDFNNSEEIQKLSVFEKIWIDKF